MTSSLECHSSREKHLQSLTGALPPEVLSHVLEPLGSSLAAALPSSRGLAQAAEAEDAAAFRPLSFCIAAASPGMMATGYPRERCGLVARAREPQKSWRDIARSIKRPAFGHSSWHRQTAKPNLQPSNRAYIAVCGAPGAQESERVLLFGGNCGNSITWRTSSELHLAEIDIDATVSTKLLTQPAGAQWPVSRWGASLTALRSCSVLWGGWSRAGDTDNAWKLWLREAAPEWCEVNMPMMNTPPHAAFHTTSVLPDGRMAVIGGLGDGGSHSGVWLFDALSDRWDLAVEGGPACAGHAAGVDPDSQRLVLFGGVQRDRNRVWAHDDFLETLSIFDIRQQRWDVTTASRHWLEDGVREPAPRPRRNAAFATLGSHMIITGGFSDEVQATLEDTWILNLHSYRWQRLPVSGAPDLEGHRAVVSGLDFITFGGRNPSMRPRQFMPIRRLRLGSHAAADIELSQGEDEGAEEESPEAQSDEEQSEDEHVDPDPGQRPDARGEFVIIRTRDNQGAVRSVRVPAELLDQLLRSEREAE